MMGGEDVRERLTQFHLHMPSIRLYALVDGVQYSKYLGEPIAPRHGFFPLFSGIPDVGIAHAGPWLIEIEDSYQALINKLAKLEQNTAALIRLFAHQDLEGLAQLLQLNLDTELPDGRMALLRFWDPRVLISLAEILDADQREQLFGQVHEWYFLHNGRRKWIGRSHA